MPPHARLPARLRGESLGGSLGPGSGYHRFPPLVPGVLGNTGTSPWAPVYKHLSPSDTVGCAGPTGPNETHKSRSGLDRKYPVTSGAASMIVVDSMFYLHKSSTIMFRAAGPLAGRAGARR
jgi:hypothetical protein